MLAEADEADVAQHHQLVVAADLLEGALQIFARVDLIAGEHLLIAAGHPCGRVDQPLALGIVARPTDQGAHRRLGLALGGTARIWRGADVERRRRARPDRQLGALVEVLAGVGIIHGGAPSIPSLTMRPANFA